jgi:hypothetical protein
LRIDLAGQPLFHKTDVTFDRFTTFSHFGTQGQANMRAARFGARIIEVTTTATRFKRLTDGG